jgi:hypothetical protein
MKHGTQPDAMKALALSGKAVLVMAQPGGECAIFDLDHEAHVLDEEIFVAARIVGFVPVGIIAVTDRGIRTECRATPEVDVPEVMAWARSAFCARLCEPPEAEIAALENLLKLEDPRADS